MRYRNQFFVSLLAMLLSASGYAQQRDDDADFCNKKWYCEMVKDAEGNIKPQEKGAESDYMHFRCDSTFTLLESGVTLNGKWSYADDTRTITLRQDQLNSIPETFSFHVIDADEAHMVIVAQSGSATQETAYLYIKP